MALEVRPAINNDREGPVEPINAIHLITDP
jgi:hypothetical protein